MKKTKIQGIIPPMITPLIDQNRLDVDGINRLIDHIISGGVHGLFILGTTGEGPGLGYDLRYELIEKACNQVEKKIPVLVGITDTSIVESLKLAEHADLCGANVVVSAPPYYFTTNQEELIGYFEFLADHLPLPLFLYNMPSHTKVRFEAETVAHLANHPNIIGYKDSSADVIHFQQVLQSVKENPEFSVLVGPEEILMQTVLSGGHGGVSGGANMFPRLYVSMYEAASERNFEKIDHLQDRILEISSSIYTVGNSPGGYLMGVKCVLSLMGICSDTMAMPYRAFDSSRREIIQQRLKSLNLEYIL